MIRSTSQKCPAPGSGQTVAALFEARAAAHPGAAALSLDGASLTYGELNARANQLAGRLRELGVGPESLVAIHLDRSFDLIVGIFAILKAGGAYLPLDHGLPGGPAHFPADGCAGLRGADG